MRLPDLTNRTSFLCKTANITITDLHQRKVFSEVWAEQFCLSAMTTVFNCVCCAAAPCVGPSGFFVVFRCVGNLRRSLGYLKELKQMLQLLPGQVFALCYRLFICFDGFLRNKVSSSLILVE